MRPLSRYTFGAVFGQCHDFENFENRSAKPVHTTLRVDTHRRSQGGGGGRQATVPLPAQTK